SSRRRHTRWPRDWSSDVCSSDLDPTMVGNAKGVEVLVRYGVLAEDPVSGGDVPPEVRVGDRLDGGDQHRHEDGDGEEMRQVEPAHGSGEPAVSLWLARGRS